MSQADIGRIRETMNANYARAQRLFDTADQYEDLPRYREECRKQARRLQADAEHARQWLEDQGDTSIAA